MSEEAINGKLSDSADQLQVKNGRIRLLLLLDGDFRHTSDGFSPVRDTLHEFFSGLPADKFDMTIASRCREFEVGERVLSPIKPKSKLHFFSLPYYASQGDRWIRRCFPWDVGRCQIRRLIDQHDVVLYRCNHTYLRHIGRSCINAGVRSVQWWAANPLEGIDATGLILRSLKRCISVIRLKSIRFNAKKASINILLDPGHTAFLPKGSRSEQIVPTLVRENLIRTEPPLRHSTNPLVVIYAGRLTKTKGVGRVIRLAEACHSSGLNVHFNVAGEGPMARDVVQAGEEGIPMTWLGNLDQPLLHKALGEAHVLILLSDTEGMPKVMWEAFAGGLPLVGTAVGGVTDVVNSGGCGVLVEANDLQEQMMTIKLLENDDRARLKMGHAALRTVRSFTMEKQLAKLTHLLTGL